MLTMGAGPKPQSLLPRGIEHALLPCDDKDRARGAIAGVPMSLIVDSCVQYRYRCVLETF